MRLHSTCKIETVPIYRGTHRRISADTTLFRCVSLSVCLSVQQPLQLMNYRKRYFIMFSFMFFSSSLYVSLALFYLLHLRLIFSTFIVNILENGYNRLDLMVTRYALTENQLGKISEQLFSVMRIHLHQE